MKKMHGLNVQQYVAARRIQVNVQNADDQTASLLTFWIDNPGALGTIIPGFSGGPIREQVYIKRLYRRVMYMNTGQFPVMFEITHLVARKDIILEGGATSSTVWAIASADGVNNSIPYVSPFTGNTFLKQFKIIRQRRKIVYPSRAIKWNVTGCYAGRTRPIARNVEGDTRFAFRKYNRLVMVRVYGTPISYVSTDGSVATTMLGPYTVNGIDREYVSWYDLDDTEPTNTLINNLYTQVPGLNVGTAGTTVAPVNPSDYNLFGGGNVVPPTVNLTATPP